MVGRVVKGQAVRPRAGELVFYSNERGEIQKGEFACFQACVDQWGNKFEGWKMKDGAGCHPGKVIKFIRHGFPATVMAEPSDIPTTSDAGSW